MEPSPAVGVATTGARDRPASVATPRHGAGRRLWVWLLPLIVAAAARYQPDRLAFSIKALLAVGVVFLVARRPQAALLVLVAVLPFQEVVLAAAYRSGLPAVVVRDLGIWKELVVAGCVVAAAGAVRDHRQSLDAIDLFALAYLMFVGLYALWPRFFVHPTGPSAIGPPTSLTTIATAVRNDAVFVVLLLAVRRLRFDATFRRRFVRVVVSAGAMVAGIGLFEFAFSNTWNHLMVGTLRVPDYLAAVLKVASRNPADIRVYSPVAGRTVLRIGSVFLDPLSCGLYLIVALAVVLELVVRGDKRLSLFLTAGLIGASIVLTQTRGALIGAGVVVACTLWPSSFRRIPARARYGVVVTTALLALVPLGLLTGAVARSTAAVGGNDQSAQVHIARTRAAFDELVAQPLGRGLGTGATNGSRFGVATTTTAEDYYLQVGAETGAASMIVFVALVVALNRRMRRLLRRPGGILAASWRGAFFGLSVAALFLQVWLDFPLSWTMWIGLGVCLGSPAEPVTVRKDRSAGVASSASGAKLGATGRHRSLSAWAWSMPLLAVTVAAAVWATPGPAARSRRFTAHSTLIVGLRQFLAAPSTHDAGYLLTDGLDRERNTLARAVTRPPVSSDAIVQIGSVRALSTVAAETSVVVPPDSQLLRISVTDGDPSVARSLADALARALVADAPTAQQSDGLAPPGPGVLSVSLADPAATAAVSVRQDRPRSRTTSATFALLAALAAAVVVESRGTAGTPEVTSADVRNSDSVG